jgi:hypothetical protein
LLYSHELVVVVFFMCATLCNIRMDDFRCSSRTTRIRMLRGGKGASKVSWVIGPVLRVSTRLHRCCGGVSSLGLIGAILASSNMARKVVDRKQKHVYDLTATSNFK